MFKTFKLGQNIIFEHLYLTTALVFNMRKIQNSYLFFIFYKKNLFDNLKCNLPNLVNSVENVDTMDLIF